MVPIESLRLGNLAKFPDFVRRPEAQLSEMNLSYQQLAIDIPKVRQVLPSLYQQPGTPRALHAHYQAAYGLLLTFALMLNTLLRAFGADDSHLLEESFTLVDETITLARDGLQYRPLGSSSMPLCLVSARAATKEPSKRLKLEQILAEYQSDFAIARWMEIATWLEAYLKKARVPLPSSLFGGGSA